MAFVRLLTVTLCCVTLVSANGKSVCPNETKRDEGSIVFQTSTFNFTGEKCDVKIRYPENDHVHLTLFNVTKEHSNSNCFRQYIDILNKTGQSVARYCTNEEKGNQEHLLVKSNAVTIIYKYLPSNQVSFSPRSEVKVHYNRVKTKPRRYTYRYTGDNGSFRSPQFPNYEHNAEYEYTISTQRVKTITVHIQTFFQLPQDRQDCDKRFIEIRDGGNVKAPLLKRICDGYGETITIQSHSSKLWIKMKVTSDSGIAFNATYKTVPFCKRISIEKPTEFSSPSQYLCTRWSLTASPGHIGALSFSNTNFKSTDDTSCFGNVIEVWDGQQTTVYCNLKPPPKIMTTKKGKTLVVTSRSVDLFNYNDHKFYARFTTVPPSSYKANCFVGDTSATLYFSCGNKRIIPCDWQCDGAKQCTDNSDENSCPGMEAKWHKLQVFVIVIGSICASTVIFCVGLVCFRKYLLESERVTDSYGRHWSTSDQAPLTPNADLPSPPPGYFNENENNVPPSNIIRGTYFFGNEFSQSGIHSASLVGIPPPRYRSTESIHPRCGGLEEYTHLQEGTFNIPLVQTNFPDDESRGDLIVPAPEDAPPDYYSLPGDDKNDQKPTSQEAENCNISQVVESTQLETTNSSNSSTDSISDTNHDWVSINTDVGMTNTVAAMRA